MPIWIGPALLLASCAHGPVDVAPLTYPSLPEPTEATVQFVPEPTLVEVQLACRATELPDNGIDDDCDGAIDASRADVPGSNDSAQAVAALLTITAAHRADGSGDVRLSLAGPTEGDAGLAIRRTVTRGAEVTVNRLEVSALPPGRYQLTAAREGADADPAELALAVSLITNKSPQTYLVRLEMGEIRTLGAIEVR